MKKKVRVRKKIKPLGFIILIVIILLVVGLVGILSKFSSKPTKNELLIFKEVGKVPKLQSFDMVMVGDALIHYGVYRDAKTSDGGYDFKPMLENMKPIISKYDLAYYNQETILGGTELGLSSYPMFNSPYEVGDAFIDCGFDVVSLATNHTMDKGERGVLNSVAYWKNHPEIVTSGQWASEEERNEPKVYEKNGIKYAFFSYTMWNNGLKTPAGKSYLSNEYSQEKAKADIEQVRDKVDVVIVAMHWGTEYSLGVSAAQAQEADYLSSIGVDLIIGAHPHVVEPMEYINDGKTFVIYSLGNFISDQDGVERLTGLMAEVSILKLENIDGTSSSFVINPKAELVYTGAHRPGNAYNSNFKLYTYSSLDDTILPGYQNYYAKYKGVVSSRYPELQWGLSKE